MGATAPSPAPEKEMVRTGVTQARPLCKKCGIRPSRAKPERHGYCCTTCQHHYPHSKRYEHGEKGRLRTRRYNHSAKGRARVARYEAQPARQEQKFWTTTSRATRDRIQAIHYGRLQS